MPCGSTPARGSSCVPRTPAASTTPSVRLASRRPPLFRIVDGFRHELVGAYERFLADNGIHVAGVEFITDRNGVAYTYDVNTNTNYNSQAEADAAAGLRGMHAVAAYLGRELERVEQAACDPGARPPRIGAGRRAGSVTCRADGGT